ncbi:PREDICTED: uncharacterized protein LOC104597257 [Nelumbo nucifera]|uniref:Uncharacterized protein LOC104597257 n=2 Tax=Nelumbo nucifera TaxID=4432 RepID=A0A1U7ZTW7_NELNU|nr:PREDICTED: uncharacterized protein LOC104597257 [Nelumbo nucifera]DAD26354.1 TPA_asm: hypothetical protein HUJ06_027822 [Nelumbo nucifera]
MAFCCIPDVWSWIHNLPPITQWRSNSTSICICSSSRSTQPSLHLSITRNLHGSFVSFSIVADFKLPVSLWTSKSFKLSTKTLESLDEEIVFNLFFNIINAFLSYGPNKSNSFVNIPTLGTVGNFKDIFNLAFLSLTFLICIYEAPGDLRSGCLNSLRNNLSSSQSNEASKLLMRLLGPNLEEQWMRSLNLAITNWIIELKEPRHTLRTPSPLFSYAISTVGLWKVQLYCPVVAMMKVENSSSNSDERLQFSLKYHQLEGVIQFGYKVIAREKWVDVMVSVDNIRCDVIQLVPETLMAERGAGAAEKYFPSRVSLQLTPTFQPHVLSVTVSKSSDNPTREIGLEKTIEAGFDPPNSYLGLKVSAAETVTLSLKPWKFEQSVHGSSANLNWFLHGSIDGREVSSKKPSLLELVQPRAWFKDRYSNANRPFTRQGGVVFAGDEYGESVRWKLDRRAIGKTLEWEIKGSIWLTYWPNKYRTFYSETRKLEFREILHHLPI